MVLDANRRTPAYVVFSLHVVDEGKFPVRYVVAYHIAFVCLYATCWSSRSYLYHYYSCNFDAWPVALGISVAAVGGDVAVAAAAAGAVVVVAKLAVVVENAVVLQHSARAGV